MGTTGNLKEIIIRQKEVLNQLETEYKAIENSDIARENIELKAELEKLRREHVQASKELVFITDQLTGLKNALYEQIYNEKVKIVNTTAKKLDIYFKSNMAEQQNNLTALENQVKAKIRQITTTLQQHNVDTRDEIYDKLQELTLLLDEKVADARQKAVEERATFAETLTDFDELKDEHMTDSQIREVSIKNNFERFIGLNLLNVVGMFLIVIGVIAAARYTYVLLPDMLKGILIFILGGAMLVVGEFMNKKKPNVFSIGMTAGGIGILYVALVTSFFGLAIINMYVALAICMIITAVAFILSTRYHSQVIVTFALIGGYLPMFSIGSSLILIYGAMIYFIVLNLLALMVSFKKKWYIASYIGLALNTIGTVYICAHFGFYATDIEKLIAILYVMFAFLIYTFIPIVSNYRTKTVFKTPDVVMLAINTVLSSLIMYAVFNVFQLDQFNGTLALAFALTYLLLGKFIEKKFPDEERHTKALFYLTGLMFMVLMVPLQVGTFWLSLGWLIEGVVLATYGILKNKKIFKKSGLVICGLCLFVFLRFDLMWIYNDLFSYKYLAMTLGSLIILGAYMYKNIMTEQFPKVYKYFAMANVWLYMIYNIIKLGNNHVFRVYEMDYLIGATAITWTFLMAYVLPRINVLYDEGTKIKVAVLYFVGILRLFVLNTTSSPVNYLVEIPLGITLVGTLILLVMGIISVLALCELMKLMVSNGKIEIAWYSIITSGYVIIVLTQNLISHYNLSFTSMLISIIYVLFALGWIVYGFIKRQSLTRRFGLGLALLAVIKLFLIDLSGLTQGYKIISYFALGITLVAISYVYQDFSKQLELKE